MKRRPFHYRPDRVTDLQFDSVKSPLQWLRTSRPDEVFFDGAASADRKGIFAVILQSARTDSADKAVRRILIFDNHPDSLRLVSRHHLLCRDAQRSGQRPSQRHLVLGLFLILVLMAAMFWPLLLAELFAVKAGMDMDPRTAAHVASAATR